MTDYRMHFSGSSVFGVELIYVKVFLVPIIMGILFLLTVVSVIFPKIEQIVNLNSDYQGLNAKTNTINQKKNYLMSVDQEGLKQKDQLISQALPQSKDLYFLLNVIGSLAGKYNYVVDSISLSPGVVSEKEEDQFAKNKNLTQVPVSVVLVGDAKSYVLLLKDIEKSLPILAITDYSLVKNSPELVSLKLTVSTYFSPRDFSKNIGNLSLKDLTLTAEETKLLDTLGTFSKLNLVKFGMGEVTTENIPSMRLDPFNY